MARLSKRKNTGDENSKNDKEENDEIFPENETDDASDDYGLDLSSDEDDDEYEISDEEELGDDGVDADDEGRGEREEGEEEDEDDDEDEDEDEDEEEDANQKEINEAVSEFMKAQPPNNVSKNVKLKPEKYEETEMNDDVSEKNILKPIQHEKEDENVEKKNKEETQQIESDSSEDERPSRNTVGNVPLKWYKDEKHIGYDREGKKIIKKEKKDKLDEFLARMDDNDDWKKIYDDYNDEEITLSKEEIKMIQKLRQGKIPHAEVNPYEPYVDWFEWDGKGHPLSSAPEPKRRFIPSKWEAKAVVKLVRSIRNGWIKFDKPKEKPKVYLMWGDDMMTAEKTKIGLEYISAPKPKLPGHDESYNPPIEYIPTEEEVKGFELMYEEDRPKFIPKQFTSMRSIPSYANFIKERFERALDLYLCPRAKKNRINIDPESLLPKLPKPKDLQPFPNFLFLEYRAHTGKVVSISVHSSGQYLLSGSNDGTVRLWETQTTRVKKIWNFEDKVSHVSFNPLSSSPLFTVAVEKNVFILNAEIGNEEEINSANEKLILKINSSSDSSVVVWNRNEEKNAITISHQTNVHSVCWHFKGDYFTSLAPDGLSKSVIVHQLSKQSSQNPFRKNHGRVKCVCFHPVRPFLFVATNTHVRVYNLSKQELAKKLIGGVNHISSMSIHPAGDNLIIGSEDMRVAWFDMDLSTKPYKTLRNHESSVRNVAFHRSYPLFASCSDDSTAHVFHSMVYSDLLQNPLIVPVKILRAPVFAKHEGFLDCAFHPHQPWLFTAGADSIIRLYCH